MGEKAGEGKPNEQNHQSHCLSGQASIPDRKAEKEL